MKELKYYIEPFRHSHLRSWFEREVGTDNFIGMFEITDYDMSGNIIKTEVLSTGTRLTWE